MYWKKEREGEINVLHEVIKRVLEESNFYTGDIQKDDPAYEIAVKVWEHKQHMDENEKNSLETAARDENKEQLSKIENILKNAHFSKTAVKQAMSILAADTERQFKPENFSKDVKEFHNFQPLSHSWIERENRLITEIQNLLNKHRPGMSDHWQIDIAKDIFVECELWTGHRNAYETMKKRFQSISQKKLSPPKSLQ